MALIPPFFLDCVVAVGFPDDEKPNYVATGFLYGHFLKQLEEQQKQYVVYLVTNRHVFAGKQRAYLRFNPEGTEPAREYEVNIIDDAGKPRWLAHSDPDVDIAVVNINTQLLYEHGIRFSWFSNDEHVATRQRAVDLGMAEGDPVYVLGFPLGLVGEGRNFVIVRYGCIARIRDCLDSGRKDFLIDCSVFPGNSGGPVVTRPEVVAIEGTKAVGASYLIGVVAAYLPYRDVAVSAQTQKPRIIFEENSGLASVIPIDYVEGVIREALLSGSAEAPPTEEPGSNGVKKDS